MQNKEVSFRDLGRNQDYQTTWDLQERMLQDTVDIKMAKRKWEREQTASITDVKPDFSTQNHLLFVEHPHVYTLGKSGKLDHLLANEKKLESIQATFVKTNRGGDITYHGPGQLVGYPILDLDNFKTDIHWYLRSLEEVIILTLSDYGLKGERSKGETGVWLYVGTPFARKICAMGVKASRWVTMHGFALNVTTDLRYFEYIVPCGIRDKAVASLERELNREISIEEVKEKVKKYFALVFEAQLI